MATQTQTKAERDMAHAQEAIRQRAPQRTTIKCNERPCLLYVRVYSATPVLSVGQYQYCPKCGSSDVHVFSDQDTDYWESLAASYHMPVDVLKYLYKQWEPSKHQRFHDFVDELKNEPDTN